MSSHVDQLKADIRSMWFITPFPTTKRSIVMSASVSVSLSEREFGPRVYLRKQYVQFSPIFVHVSCNLWSWLGFPLMALRYICT